MPWLELVVSVSLWGGAAGLIVSHSSLEEASSLHKRDAVPASWHLVHEDPSMGLHLPAVVVLSVPLKVWLTGAYLVALLASSAARTRAAGCATGKSQQKASNLDSQETPKLPNSDAGVVSLAPGATPCAETQPLVANKARLQDRIEAVAILIVWMVMSPMFIIFNKWMLSKGGFPYPVTLTAMHMGSCWIVFGAISWLPKEARSKIMPDVDVTIPWKMYLRGFVPAALFMAVGLGFGNIALLHASVVFVQLVKPVNVVVTSLAGFAWGLEVRTSTHMIIVLIVTGGVMTAAFGGAEFSMVGLLCQLTASVGEGLRLIILQGVMQTNLKLDPVTTVYRFAPLAGLTLCFLSFVIDKPLELGHIVSGRMVVLNCCAAVLLNVLIALVISRTSAVVSVLAGITKDIGTIIVSAYIYTRPIGLADIVGYCMSLSGICMYKVYKDRLAVFVAEGFVGGWREILLGSTAASSK